MDSIRKKSSFRAQLMTPVLSRLLRPRWHAWVVLAAAAAQLGGSMLGVSLWVCPFHAFTGMPCPGCGLSRAIVLFLQGHWGEAFQAHAFAPLFFLGFVVMGVVSCLPGAAYQKTLVWIETFERQTGLTAVILISLMIYWLVRLITMGIHFI